MGSVTFKNDRQKASVSVYKQDKETRKYLPGGTYGLYAGNDIKAADGTIVVKKDTLIEKAVTGTDGKAVYQADLPIANNYYMKELGAPAGYVRNGEDVYSFTFQYTTDKEATVSFNHTFQNERINAKIKLVKEDSETGKTAQEMQHLRVLFTDCMPVKISYIQMDRQVFFTRQEHRLQP